MGGLGLNTIFVAIPSYHDADLPATLDSAIRMSSGRNIVHLAVCEQVTRYASGYLLARELPEHVFISVEQVGDKLIGLGGARHLAESFFAGEDLQVQTDSHTRFDSDWDTRLVELCARLGDGVASANMMPDPWSHAGRIPVVRYERFTHGIPAGHVEVIEPPSGRLSEMIPSRAIVGAAWSAAPGAPTCRPTRTSCSAAKNRRSPPGSTPAGGISTPPVCRSAPRWRESGHRIVRGNAPSGRRWTNVAAAACRPC